MDNKEYIILSKFQCNGKSMVTVEFFDRAVHVMTEEEWKWVYGILHPERWNSNVSKEIVV